MLATLPFSSVRLESSDYDLPADRRLDMALLVLVALLLALDLAAWRWGHDSRDGRDWRS
jgi:hypothetical protein